MPIFAFSSKKSTQPRRSEPNGLREPWSWPRLSKLETLALLLLTLFWGLQTQQLIGASLLGAALALGGLFSRDRTRVFSHRTVRWCNFGGFFIAAGLAFWLFAERTPGGGFFWSFVQGAPLLFLPRLALSVWGDSQQTPILQRSDGPLLARFFAETERIGEQATPHTSLISSGLDDPRADLAPARGALWPALTLALATASAQHPWAGALAAAGFSFWLVTCSIFEPERLWIAQSAGRAGPFFRTRLLFAIIALLAAALGILALQGAESLANRSHFSSSWRNGSSGQWSSSLFRASFGRSGILDLPGSLAWRVRRTPETNPTGAFYLRMGVFNDTEDGAVWTPQPPNPFSPTLPSTVVQADSLNYLPYAPHPEAAQARERFEITGTPPHGVGPLPLPEGAFLLGSAPASALDESLLGSLSVKNSTGTWQYFSDAIPGANFGPAPGPADLHVPRRLNTFFRNYADHLDLSNDSVDTAAKLKAFFHTFTYTLNMGNGRTLVDFLQRDHRGHCEYFASATVLLLRASGIPARLSTGFLVQEFDPSEGQWWVRDRDAHAWATYWDGEQWRDLDTTPPGSRSGEPGHWDWLYDSVARAQYAFENIDLSGWAKASAWSPKTQREAMGAIFMAFLLLADALWQRERQRRRPGQQAQSLHQTQAMSAWIAQIQHLRPHPHRPQDSDTQRVHDAQELLHTMGLPPRNNWVALAQRREQHIFGAQPLDPSLTPLLRHATREAQKARVIQFFRSKWHKITKRARMKSRPQSH